jgi:3-phosphoshikimate 1-carboxyvinyltransferase
MPASPTDRPAPLTVERSTWLRGTLRVPGDAMIAQLALACAALAVGESTIEGAPPTAAVETTANALGGLGVTVSHDNGRWRVNGLGVGGLLEPEAPLDLKGSAFGQLLLAGLAGGCDFPTTLKGDGRYSREMEDLAGLLGQLDVKATAATAGRLPITLRGPHLMVPADLALADAAAGVRAGVLLAALNARGTSRFRGAAQGQIDRMLAAFGATVRTAGDDARTVEIDGLPALRGRNTTVPGDPALAAMVAAAAVVVPGSEVVIEGVLLDPSRIAIFSALVAMGAGVTLHHAREAGGERIADIVVRQQPLHGNSFAEPHVALLAPDLPLLAAAAAVADGDTTFALAGDIALLHHARLTDLSASLRALGVESMVAEDGFLVRGAPRIRGGGPVATGADGGIAFACLVLGMAAERQVTIDDQTGIEERFPGFSQAFEAIGANFVR